MFNMLLLLLLFLLKILYLVIFILGNEFIILFMGFI